MLSAVTRNWWVAALRGILALLFGAAALAWPGVTLELLVFLFGAYAFVDGMTTVGLGFLGAGTNERWLAMVLSGGVGVLAGVLTFAQPLATAVALVYVIVAWAIIAGGLQIVAAIRLRDVISDEWLMGLSGALSIVLGILLLAAPAAGALTLVLLFGFYAISTALSQLGLGLRLRRLGQQRLRPQSAASAAR